MDDRVASRYAKALFSAATKEGIVDSVATDLHGIADTLERDVRFRKFIENPEVARGDKTHMFETVFSDRVTARTMSAIRLLLQKGREELIGVVRDRFIELKQQASNVLSVKITSALPLDPAHKQAIIDKISKATGKSVVETTEVQPSLIGGVKVEMGGFVMDGTLVGGLNRLKETFLLDVLKQS